MACLPQTENSTYPQKGQGESPKTAVETNYFIKAIKCSGFWHLTLYPLRRVILDSFVEKPFPMVTALIAFTSVLTSSITH